jgi:hypothetical protein
VNRRVAWLAPLLACMVFLGGCAPENTDLSAEAAAQMQTMVVSVAETTATGDHAGAIVQLDALQAELDAARGRGHVSDERAATIQAAIDLLRADLLHAAEPDDAPSEPVEEPVEPQSPAGPGGEDDADDGGNDNDGGPGNGNDGGPGNGNDGNDGNDGNGNGNDRSSGNRGNGNG